MEIISVMCVKCSSLIILKACKVIDKVAALNTGGRNRTALLYILYIIMIEATKESDSKRNQFLPSKNNYSYVFVYHGCMRLDRV